jgi:hypothetical protein
MLSAHDPLQHLPSQQNSAAAVSALGLGPKPSIGGERCRGFDAGRKQIFVLKSQVFMRRT